MISRDPIKTATRSAINGECVPSPSEHFHVVNTRTHIDARSPTYYERFQGGFVREVNTFTECVLDDKRKQA
jgi:hypothetical protein